jgi:carbamoyl-phosphate synthase small subunit
MEKSALLTMRKRAFLALEDGYIFSGFSNNAEGTHCGEVIFNTSMGGYQEVCTDPSYANQIILFTHPHIGNVGTNEEDNESSHCWISGIIMKEPSKRASNWRSTQTFPEFLLKHQIPALYGIDTRRLTNHIRESGSQIGCLAIGDISIQEAVLCAQKHAQSDLQELSFQVSTKTIYSWNSGLWNKNSLPPSLSVCVYDFGVKRSILRRLVSLGCRVTVVSPSYTYEELLSLNPDGIVLSNGPGDPQKSTVAKKAIEELIKNKIPLLGICFGCQLLGLAAGGKTVKMKLGHHGSNHPVLDLKNNKSFITSQNHDFVLSDEGLPSCLEITHRSLVDNSIEGIRFRGRPIFGFQGHPEGGPGPFDLCGLFHEFVHLMDTYAKRSFT